MKLSFLPSSCIETRLHSPLSKLGFLAANLGMQEKCYGIEKKPGFLCLIILISENANSTQVLYCQLPPVSLACLEMENIGFSYLVKDALKVTFV